MGAAGIAVDRRAAAVYRAVLVGEPVEVRLEVVPLAPLALAQH